MTCNTTQTYMNQWDNSVNIGLNATVGVIGVLGVIGQIQQQEADRKALNQAKERKVVTFEEGSRLFLKSPNAGSYGAYLTYMKTEQGNSSVFAKNPTSTRYFIPQRIEGGRFSGHFCK
jgi:hypothetical protein